MGAILLIGDKPLILSSYTAVLATLGRTVVVCNTSECISSHLRKTRIDLVVVCFTVTDRSRRSITSDTFARSPRPQILQVVRPDESTHLAFGADAYVSSVDPVAFVGRVRTMLGEQELQHPARLQESYTQI